MNGDDFFDKWGETGDKAFAILQDGCEFPPSLEVFEHGLEAARSRSGVPVHVLQHARFVAENYRRAD